MAQPLDQDRNRHIRDSLTQAGSQTFLDAIDSRACHAVKPDVAGIGSTDD
jgi:hypothetical protein